MYKLPDGIKSLEKFKQFIIFKVVNGKKYPVDHRTGKRPIDPFKPKNWINADTAIASADRLGKKHWAGFVLTDIDPFFCLSIREPYGDIRIMGSYRGKAPPHSCKHRDHNNIELHTKKYIYTLTRNPNPYGNIETDGTEALHDYIKTNFPPRDTINNQYFQTVTVSGEAKNYLLKHLNHFNLPIPPSSEKDALYFEGAGKHFPPYLHENIECKCIEQYGDVFKKLNLHPKVNKPFPKAYDLTPIVEFLKLGGTGYGYPDYNA